MSNASKVVTAWITGILGGTHESAAHHLSPKLEWRENGLSQPKASKQHPRPKWQGLQHPGARKALKDTSNGEPSASFEVGGLVFKRTLVCGDDKSEIGRAHV